MQIYAHITYRVNEVIVSRDVECFLRAGSSKCGGTWFSLSLSDIYWHDNEMSILHYIEMLL